MTTKEQEKKKKTIYTGIMEDHGDTEWSKDAKRRP